MASQIDPLVFNELRKMTDPSFLSHLVDAFLEDAPAQFELMQSALASGDAGEFRRAAHSIKSNAATFGAASLSELARELEMLGKEGRLEEAGKKLQEIHSLFVLVARELRELSR